MTPLWGIQPRTRTPHLAFDRGVRAGLHGSPPPRTAMGGRMWGCPPRRPGGLPLSLRSTDVGRPGLSASRPCFGKIERGWRGFARSGKLPGPGTEVQRTYYQCRGSCSGGATSIGSPKVFNACRRSQSEDRKPGPGLGRNGRLATRGPTRSRTDRNPPARASGQRT